ncbi:MAG: tRNA (adenosine(37)-N6)-threonylcarbamoyltransferase complex dimerization subunit type 1 TsaB [Betaproteobacteria bacterium]|nr:tRNA (adenosine(37)-N6)-threonylcarbamoyltransferase complex dimerization subunit type 1 TsaB [Betaproteobacteria bacterium]
MNLLAFDTSTEYLSLALLRGDDVFTFNTMAGQSHSQLILPQLQKLLHEAELQLEELQGIAFGAGPGSFTGVRIAAGVAQGLGFGAHLSVVGVCTLMALAEGSGADQVITCLDARMGEVYHAAYIKEAGTWRAERAPGLYKPDAVPRLDGFGWVGAGNGWQAYSEALGQVYADQLQAVRAELVPTANSILTLALPVFSKGEATPASEALPVYIRNRVALKTEERAQGLAL